MTTAVKILYGDTETETEEEPTPITELTDQELQEILKKAGKDLEPAIQEVAQVQREVRELPNFRWGVSNWAEARFV